MSDEAASLSAAQKLEVFRRATALLASSRSFEETMEHTIAAFLPALADFGFFDLDVGDRVRRTARAYEDARVDAILRPTQWIRQERTDMNLCALSTGRPALHAAIDDAWYQAIAVNEGHLQVLRDLAFCSMVTVPMRYQGELLGALTIFFGRSGRHHSDDDLAFAGDLAALCAPVVAAARLLEQQRATSERLRIGMDAGKLGIWDWDIPRNHVSWTDRLFELLGTTREAFDSQVHDLAMFVDEVDRDRTRQIVEEALRAGDGFETEFRVRMPDGTIRWLETRAEVRRDDQGKAVRMVGATHDVTRRQLLARSVQLFSRPRALDDTLDAITTLTVPDVADWCRIDLVEADGTLRAVRIVHADPALAARGAAVSHDWRSAPDTYGSTAWIAATGQIYSVQLRPEQLESLGDSAMGQFIREIGLTGSLGVPLVARGRTLGVLTLLFDRTSQRNVTDELRGIVEELASRAALALDNAMLYADAERARTEAEAASRAKDEFLAMLGHELRNPLAPIVTALHLLERRDGDRTRRERAVIERQVTHMRRLVDDLLDVSRIQRDKITVVREPVDLRTVIEKAIESTRPALLERQLTLDVAMPERPVVVQGDAVRLVQTVVNLLSNAAKFSTEGQRVEVRLTADDDQAELVVRDHGVGIAPALLPHVFEMFVQGPQQLAREQGGLGLGLAIVAKLVHLQGGRVSAESDGLGQGATFRIRLPLAASVRPATPPGAFEVPAVAGSARVLVVDDNIDAGELLTELLRASGYDVQLATSGPGGLNAIASFTPQIGVLDIGLPGMTGYDLALALRARIPDIHLVAVTGYGQAADRVRAREAGFDEHFVKPVDPEALLRHLEQIASAGPPARTPDR